MTAHVSSDRLTPRFEKVPAVPAEAPNASTALDFVLAAKRWLDDDPAEAVALGFDPHGSALLLLDRAEEILVAVVATEANR